MSPGRGTFPNGLQGERNCQRVAAGERLNGSAGMSRTEGTDGLCPSGNGAVLGPSPPPRAACRDLLSAPGQLPGSGRRWDVGTSRPPWPLPPPPWCQPRPAVQHPKPLQPAGSFVREGGVLGSGSPTPPVRLLGSSLPAPKPVRWHQTRSHSTPRPWEQWVTGKSFFFNHYFWRYSDPRIEFMHKIGLLSQGI